MTRISNRKSGFGLVEVIIALAVLATGILAMAQLQTSALGFTSRAESMRALTRVAEAEISWQQLNSLAGRASGLSCTGDECFQCDSDLPAGMTCRLEVVPCGVVVPTDGSPTFVCASGVSSAQAFELRLDISDNRGNAASFQTIATGRYVAGVRSEDSGGVSDDDEQSGTEPPDDGGTTTPPPPPVDEEVDETRPGNRPPNVGGGRPGGTPPGRNR